MSRSNTAADCAIDFLIITPLPEEREAVLARLPNHRRLPPSTEDIRVYYSATAKTGLPGDPNGFYSLIVAPLAGMGLTDAATATADAVRRWQPRYVVLVGIAGGMANNGVALGDVLIADQVADYEVAKVTAAESAIRWKVHPVDPRLLLAAQNFAFSPTKLQATRPVTEGGPRTHFGPICTGNKVIADSTLATEFQSVWRKLIGVEMEAGGVANSVMQAVSKPGFFMVRGVSDLADAAKDSELTARWRGYACEVAAAWTIDFLESGPVPALSKVVDSSAEADPPKHANAGVAKPALPKNSTALERIQSTFPSFSPQIVGRQTDLEQITTLLQTRGHSVVCLRAIGGMGKTALAKEWCLKHYAEYEEILGARLTDGEFLVSTDGPQDQLAKIKSTSKSLAKREYLAKVGEQLGIVSSQDDEFYEKKIVEKLGDKRTLFLLDNLETDPDAAALLASLLKICQAPTRTALVTTRVLPNIPTSALGSRSLMALDETSSRSLVENWLHEKDPQLNIRESTDAVASIVEIAVGHPLALELLSGKMLTFGTESIMALRNKWKKDDAGSLSDDAMETLCSFIFDDRFHTHLGTAGVDLLRLIANKPRGAEEISSRRAFLLMYDDFEGHLNKLFETGCIFRRNIEGRPVLLMHPLTRAYFRQTI